MTGLEKILGQIKDDAVASANKLLAQAQAEADTLYAAGQEETAKLCDEWKKQRDTEIKLTLSRGQSAAKLQERKMLLLAKQQIINEVIEAAKQKLYKLPDHEYFELILKLISKCVQSQAGEILFSEKDLKRVPDSFTEEIKKYSLTVSKNTRNLDGGFILLYAGIEENCSFDALFMAKRENLQDKVCDLLFE